MRTEVFVGREVRNRRGCGFIRVVVVLSAFTFGVRWGRGVRVELNFLGSVRFVLVFVGYCSGGGTRRCDRMFIFKDGSV